MSKDLKVSTPSPRVSTPQATNAPAPTTFIEPKNIPRTSSPVNAYDIANWSIFPGPNDGDIIARNNRTFEVYNGTMAEFNKLLRGE